MLLIIFIVVLLGLLAFVNGANDVSKGVATLVGSSVAKYRTAILWGAVTTLAGALLSGVLSIRLLRLFSTGITSGQPSPEFTLAVLCGAAGWILLATWTRLPVSTTHTIIGALLGAGLIFSPSQVQWFAVLPRFVAPLLLSIAASYCVSALLNKLVSKTAKEATCLCVGLRALDAGPAKFVHLHVLSGTASECESAGDFLRLKAETFHWLSSGFVGFARGLNDTPKLVAIGVIVLGESNLGQMVLLISAAMFAGSIYAGRRVARVLAEKVICMDHREGLLANVTTSLLVGVGATLGLPMSTTQVSTGAIAGIAGRRTSRLNAGTVRGLVLAWTITPLVAGIISMVAFLSLSRAF